MKVFSLVFLFVALAASKVYFEEDFSGDWESRWVLSTFKGDEAGKFEVSAGKFYNDAEKDAGLRTSEDARFYQISAEFPEFTNKDKDLVFQFSAKHEQNIDCGGGYLKLMPAGVDQANFNGDDVYNIMFGPDICGSSNRRTHVIFRNGEENHLIKSDVRTETDVKSHLYTLIVRPDNTIEVRIDGETVREASLKDDFDILLPREINDPESSKPDNWDDRVEIADPEDVKPDGWDDIPAEIVDPEAAKPEDWDDELDGDWEPPMIDNPEYQGEWEADMIPNPDYKGPWEHPQVPNPDFKDDDTLYSYESFKYIGLEIWQVKSGTIFDNILVTDSVEEAEAVLEAFKAMKEGEDVMFDKQEEERRAKEEEERKLAELEEEEEEDSLEEPEEDEEVKDEL